MIKNKKEILNIIFYRIIYILVRMFDEDSIDKLFKIKFFKRKNDDVYILKK